ncbi:MAG: radical SAM protein [Clostridiales bacterium]|nr:radical SAM protein [Clostridiales bacterium]MDD6936911.1 radical SAM protein [Clostridiales bacterium]MDY2962602.1 radical SAM protein [Oscillospiraceae bacterium]
MSPCSLCPRRCGADRAAGQTGFCGAPEAPVVARAAPHFGEEPCISGTRGSGAVFFAGCNLRCVFCQNYALSRNQLGREITVQRLRDIFLELRDQGVHNINLVTPSHDARAIAQALDGLELGVPVVWNSSGYESVKTLRMLEGLVQIYLPDLKYADAALAARYSAALDYPETAGAAILEMFRQTGPFRMDGDGLLQSGVLIRHLILPEQGDNSRRVIDWVSDTFEPGDVLFSLMSQYTPMGELSAFPELRHTVSPALNAAIYAHLLDSRIEDGFYQDLEAATGELIPKFDGTGV